MSTNPLDTPEARQHADACRVLYTKLETFLGQAEESPEFVRENDGRAVLQVMPTRDESGRVRMTIDQLATLLDIPRDELLDPSVKLAFESDG